MSLLWRTRRRTRSVRRLHNFKNFNGLRSEATAECRCWATPFLDSKRTLCGLSTGKLNPYFYWINV